MGKKVAGTIMIHLSDDSKRFLVYSTSETKEFPMTEALEGQTALANYLNFLKEEIQIDVTKIDLVELTNTNAAGCNTPLFVFEAKYHDIHELPEGFEWAEPESVREILTTNQIEGVPLF